MINHYTEEMKHKLVNLYTTGSKVKSLCDEFNIPRSTMYYWLNRYKVIRTTDSGVITVNDIYRLKTKLKKVEIENRILKECGCTAASSRKEKLEAIACLDGRYTIHALCRALHILRSTYYHYKLRRPEKTLVEKE